MTTPDRSGQDVTIRASVSAHGLRKGQVTTVGWSPLIQGALDGGVFTLVGDDPWPPPEPVGGPPLIYICVVCKVERADVADGKRSIDAGAYLPECPNCGSSETPQPYVEPVQADPPKPAPPKRKP